MADYVTHYQIGKEDPRIKNAINASVGAHRLHKLIKRENKGLDIKVILPRFILSTDNTTLFMSEGCANEQVNDVFVIGISDDTGMQSAY